MEMDMGMQRVDVTEEDVRDRESGAAKRRRRLKFPCLMEQTWIT